MVWRAFRTDTAELAWLGLFFLSVSLLPLVHGLTTPGVIYGPNEATMVSVRIGGVLISGKADKSFRAEIDDTISIRVPPEHCHLFDTSDGKRIGP